jgi:predicted aconitase
VNLTKEQQAILDGEKGDVLARIMKTLIRYGELFGADAMVPVTSKYNHLVTSFGLKALKPVYELMDKLIEAGNLSTQKFSADPRPLDPNVPSNFLQNFIFKNFMYSRQEEYEVQLNQLGLMEKDAFTCTCYMDEVGNTPAMGEVLSWSESSAVVYANSVLGARCNRNSGIIDLMGSVLGYVPYFGLLTDEGRKAKWIVKIETTKKPEAQLLGSAIGMKVMEDVPYIVGLDKWLGGELNDAAKTYLKDFGAATASNGAVGLYHVENITPEAVQMGESLIEEGAKVYVVDDAELERVYKSYPVIWKNKEAKPKLCFMGCPHMSLEQLTDWTKKIQEALKAEGKSKVCIPTVFTAAPAVLKKFEETPYAAILKETGVITSYICPLMYMNNPLSEKMPVITSSNKLRTYTSARYYTDAEILEQITKGGAK